MEHNFLGICTVGSEYDNNLGDWTALDYFKSYPIKIWHIFKISEAWLITHWYYWRKDVQTFCFCLIASKRSSIISPLSCKIDLQWFWNIWEQMLVCDNLVKVWRKVPLWPQIHLYYYYHIQTFIYLHYAHYVFRCSLVTIRFFIAPIWSNLGIRRWERQIPDLRWPDK